MPLPTITDVRPVDPVMTQLSIGFKNPRYFWDQIAPPVEVAEKSALLVDKILTWSPSNKIYV